MDATIKMENTNKKKKYNVILSKKEHNFETQKVSEDFRDTYH